MNISGTTILFSSVTLWHGMLIRPTDIFLYETETGKNIQFLILTITGGREIGKRKGRT